MDPRTPPSELESTGTMPLQGEGMPVAPESPATEAAPARSARLPVCSGRPAVRSPVGGSGAE